jgi:hypothetical protein
VLAYCGELRSFNDPKLDDTNTQYVHGINDKLVIDANQYVTANQSRVFGRGYLVNECFERDANVVFRPNAKEKPTYLIGHALVDLRKGDEILTNYGKEYWCVRAHFETLDTETKKQCKAHYSIKENQIK